MDRGIHDGHLVGGAPIHLFHDPALPRDKVGPIFGAGFVVALQNTLATSSFPVTITTGLIFMVCVLVFRPGVGEVYAWLETARRDERT